MHDTEAMILFLPAQQLNPGLPNISKLKGYASTLSSLSYLYQGFPDLVNGVTFTYSDANRGVREVFVSNLLCSDSESFRPLRDAATNLASRTYVDKSGRIVLLMSRRDAIDQLSQIQISSQSASATIDPLFAEFSAVVSAYYYSVIDIDHALRCTVGSGRSDGAAILIEVRSRLRKLKIATKIDSSWNRPVISR